MSKPNPYATSDSDSDSDSEFKTEHHNFDEGDSLFHQDASFDTYDDRGFLIRKDEPKPPGIERGSSGRRFAFDTIPGYSDDEMYDKVTNHYSKSQKDGMKEYLGKDKIGEISRIVYDKSNKNMVDFLEYFQKNNTDLNNKERDRLLEFLINKEFAFFMMEKGAEDGEDGKEWVIAYLRTWQDKKKELDEYIKESIMNNNKLDINLPILFAVDVVNNHKTGFRGGYISVKPKNKHRNKSKRKQKKKTKRKTKNSKKKQKKKSTKKI